MKATTWRGGASGILPTTSASANKKKRKKKAPTPRGFMCGCGGTRSVSVSALTPPPPVKKQGTSPAAAASSAGDPPPSSAAKTTTTTPGCGRAAAAADASAEEEGTPSVDSLLRQLQELERGVRALGVRERHDGDGGGGSSGGAAGTTATTTARPPPRRRRRSGSVVDSESCVAVVRETADPLGDFRRSMAEMVVENGITGGAELRGLLRRFLALNHACHHGIILQAFADVCEADLFAAHSRGHGKGPSSTRPR